MTRLQLLLGLALAVVGCRSPQPDPERQPAVASSTAPQASIEVALLFARVVEQHAALGELLDFIAEDDDRREFDGIELILQPGSTPEKRVLRGANEAALSGYLRSVYARNPELQPPAEIKLAFGRSPQSQSARTGPSAVRAYWLERASLLDISAVRGATIKQDNAGQDAFVLTLDNHDAEAFERLTTDAQDHMIAIIVAGAVISAPIVRHPVTDGVVHISMGFTSGSQGPNSAEAFGRDLLGDEWERVEAAANEDSLEGLR